MYVLHYFRCHPQSHCEAISLDELAGQSKRCQCSAYLKGTGELLNFAAKKLSGGDLLVVATNGLKPAQALNMYRKRWHIECLFSDIKTRGFNMESTRMTNTEKLSVLLVVLTLALCGTQSYKCANLVFGKGGDKPNPSGESMEEKKIMVSGPALIS